MSTNLLEKLTNGLEVSLAILPNDVGTSKTQTLGQYLRRILDQNGMKPHAVEQRSAAEAKRRGLDVKQYTISDAKVNDILGDVPGNHTMSKLCGLAWAIDRPIEEVAAHAFGFADRLSEFQNSDVFGLWEVLQKLNGEDAKYYAKRVVDLRGEIDNKLKIAKKPLR